MLALRVALRVSVPGWAVGQEAKSQRWSATATALEGAALTADPLPLGLPRPRAGSSSSPCMNTWHAFPPVRGGVGLFLQTAQGWGGQHGQAKCDCWGSDGFFPCLGEPENGLSLLVMAGAEAMIWSPGSRSILEGT